jgi:hypothetical protein
MKPREQDAFDDSAPTSSPTRVTIARPSELLAQLSGERRVLPRISADADRVAEGLFRVRLPLFSDAEGTE